MTYLTNERTGYRRDPAGPSFGGPLSSASPIDRLFGDFWALPSRASDFEQSAAWAPPADIEEEEGHYLLKLDVPGVNKEDVSIEVEHDQVLVSGTRKAAEKPGLYSERRAGKFQRSFTLPTHVDTSKIEAKYEDGVLSIHVPKAESAKPRQIKISG
ncbi:MAG: Hsp20/alpha crystallin family protein [Bdellovibrionota bacterium]